MKREDDRNYYMHPEGGFSPRKDRPRTKKPWYNQRWLLAVILLAGVAAIVLSVAGLTQEVAGVNESIQEQTAAIEEQTNVLVDMKQAVLDAAQAVEAGFQRLIAEIHAIADQFRDLA